MITVNNFGKDPNYRDLEELSIRDEFDTFMNGKDFGQEKVNVFVVQRIRRNPQGDPKKCSCWNPIQNEGAPGCPSCGGLGLQFDEILLNGYMSNPENKRLLDSLNYKDNLGRTNEVYYVFYTNYCKKLYAMDIVLRPVMDNEGFLAVPLSYAEEYKLTSSFDLRLDENRMEYHFYTCQRTR